MRSIPIPQVFKRADITGRQEVFSRVTLLINIIRICCLSFPFSLPLPKTFPFLLFLKIHTPNFYEMFLNFDFSNILNFSFEFLFTKMNKVDNNRLLV